MIRKVFIFFAFTILHLSTLSCVSSNQKLYSDLIKLENTKKWKIVFSDGRDIYFLSIDGKYKPIEFKDKAFQLYPSFSPDGRRIAFCEIVGMKSSLLISDLNGDNIQILYKVDGNIDCVAWAPDGNKILFLTNYNSEKASEDICLFDFKTHSIKTLVKELVYAESHYTPSWSPDSRKIVFASMESYILIVDIISGDMQKLLKADAPSWAPDNQVISFREGHSYRKIYPDGSEEYIVEGDRYFTITPDGEKKNFLFKSEDHQHLWGITRGAKAPLVWSPDGRFILFFTHYSAIWNSMGTPYVYIMDVKSKETVCIGKLPTSSSIWGLSWAQQNI
jgi:Tol biopolymer transport system component